MTEFHAQITGVAVQTDIQCMTLGFGEEPDGGDGPSIMIAGPIPEDELPPDEELFDNGEYTICIDSANVAEACVLEWKVEPGKLHLLLSPEGAADLEVDERLVIFFSSESTAVVKEALTKIFVTHGDGPTPRDLTEV